MLCLHRAWEVADTRVGSATQGILGPDTVNTRMTKSWGDEGEPVECYGVDLDAIYVTTDLG